MTILISLPTPGGLTRYCKSNCHNAQREICVCVCRGINHGIGIKQAAINTHDHFNQIVNDQAIENPDASTFQLSLDNLVLHGERSEEEKES